MLSERVEYWVQRKWNYQKDFEDAIKCDLPEDATAYRNLEDRRLGTVEHRAVKRVITEEVL